MAHSFKAGDVVKLKSGSHLMTVTHNGNDGQVYCTWFVTATSSFSTNSFVPEVLTPEKGKND